MDFWRWMMLGLLVGCPGPEDTGPTDGTDATDDTDTVLSCDFSAIAGRWTGTGQNGAVELVLDIVVSPSAEVDARIASGDVQTSNTDPIEACGFENLCLARTQNDWHVVRDVIVSGPCTPGYTFYRLEDDGTLSMDGAKSEFGEHTRTSTLTRAD